MLKVPSQADPAVSQKKVDFSIDVGTDQELGQKLITPDSSSGPSPKAGGLKKNPKFFTSESEKTAFYSVIND